MNTMKMILIGVFIGVIGFFAGIAWMISSAISGEIDMMPLMFGFAMAIIGPVAGLFLGMLLNRPKIVPTPAIISPLAEETPRETVYCPVCHANLGPDAPRMCPECGHML